MRYGERLEQLRDKAAARTLARIRSDGERVFEVLRPLFPVIEAQLFDGSFNSAALWRLSQVDRNHAARFADELGLTPWTYVTDRRLDVGAVLLDTTDAKVWQIGNVLGYTSPSSFSKAWKNRRGTSPKARRQPAAKPQSSRLARGAYSLVESLPVELVPQHRRLAVSCDTKALLQAFCPDCRAQLQTIESFAMRTALNSALSPVHLDLPWFQSCCDPCYRLFWDAVSRGRLGLEQDAWKAWWLSENVDILDTAAPPSRGRIIAALTNVERLSFGDQKERLDYCELAVGDASALADPLLQAQARIWRGNVLRAMGRFSEASADFAAAAPFVRATPWLAALKARFEGILADHTNDYTKALELFRSAITLYKILDQHIAGLLLIQQGGLKFYQADYAESVLLFQRSLSLLDSRRDSSPAGVHVPLNLTAAFACLRNWEEADAAISKCRLDPADESCLSATKVFTLACLELDRGRPRNAVDLFEQAAARFEKLHRPLDQALVASYSVEAYVLVDDRAMAIRCAEAAFRFFQAAGCPDDTLSAIRQLQQLLKEEVVDTISVAADIRRIARSHGGWLPAPVKTREAISLAGSLAG